MPCDTPPPPPSMDTDVIDEDPDDSMYEVIDMNELEDMPVDDSCTTIDLHNDAVFCGNFNKTGHYIVTGGQDETAYVYDIVEEETKFQCTGHTDSIISVNFSPDSNYAATADMKGLIQVWDVNDGSLVWNFDTYEITWSEWLQEENVLLAGSADGNCWKWNIPDGTSTVFEYPTAGCSTGCVSHNDKKLVTGYQDGTIKLWDIPNHKLLNTLTGSVGHNGTVTSAKFSADDSLIITGSVDGTAKLIKSSDFKVIWTVSGCSSNHEDVSIETLGFSQTLSYIVTGTNCGCLCIWDMQTKTKRQTVELESAIVKIICDDLVPVVYVAVADGTLQAYDIRTGTVVKYWRGHQAAILDLVQSSDKNFFLTTSDDHTCKIFERGSL